MIGVAIPCYQGHFNKLSSLIQNIGESTVKPDHIAISCSSWTHDRRVNTAYNGIPVSVQYSRQRLNQATNRNIAASMLATTLVSFIDADDLMHPSRLEYVCRAFRETKCEAIYHDYTWEHAIHYTDPFPAAEPYRLVSNPVVPDPNAVGLMVGPYSLHHAHVTVRYEVLRRFKFDESWDAYRKEDSLYGRTLAENGVSLGFLSNKLTRYIFTGTQ
jgi:hypothetical protein